MLHNALNCHATTRMQIILKGRYCYVEHWLVEQTFKQQLNARTGTETLISAELY